jgi:hypothetical protein
VSTAPTKPLPGTTRDPLYPDSDEQPMGEGVPHLRAMISLVNSFDTLFAGRSDVLIAADLVVYYEHGNPSAVRAPDVLVAKGVGNHFRGSYRLWEEGKLPEVVVEIS